MADGDLQSIISGVDPTSAMQLQALQGNQISSAAANPANWTSLGPFAGLARQLALGQGMSMAQGGVNQAVEANLAAQPSLANLIANPNPLTAAQDPNIDPVARARWMAAYGTPSARLQLGQTGEAQAQASLAQSQANLNQWLLQNRQNPSLGRTGYVGAPSGGAAVPPATTGTRGAIGGGRYPATNTTTLPIDPSKIPPAKFPAYLATLNPAQRAQAIAWLRAQHSAAAPAPAQ